MRHFLAISANLLILLLWTGQSAAANLAEALQRLESLVPRQSTGFASVNTTQTAQTALLVEQTAAALPPAYQVRQPAAILANVQQLLNTKLRVDRLLETTLAQRSGFAAWQSAEDQRQALRNYLRVNSQLIDLSGRLRYLLYDVLSGAAAALATRQREQNQLIDMLITARSSIGAMVMSDLLFDPPPDAETAGRPPSPLVRSKVLQLIAVSGESELLGGLADFLNTGVASPALVIQTAETIRQLGLPQDPRPGQDPTLPLPEITAKQLRTILQQLDSARLDSSLQQRRQNLLAWLDDRIKNGITDGRCQLGPCEVRPGDWLLMRNPSPYNLFTDLSPGLFTHVGVVAFEKGSDGIGRIVLVDLPERGDRMPATNIDTFVKRTRHYVFLRHDDPAVSARMAEAAASTIGNETQFDLNFRTDRVMELAGQPLAGKKITTYCAGLLLLCALQTDQPREVFFPIAEYPAGGNTQKNLAQLGLTFGENFISPTGALFSARMKIVGRREPMYDPRREVEEAIFDHFATSLMHKTLEPSPDLFQSLRLKVAEASKHNPLLAEAVAKAAGVNAELDLVAAAKAAAVVETLDDVAYSNSGEFLQAQQALRSGPIAQIPRGRRGSEQVQTIQKFRQRHSQLYALWTQGRITPRGLRIELVKFYIDRGRKQLDERFFKQSAAERSTGQPSHNGTTPPKGSASSS